MTLMFFKSRLKSLHLPTCTSEQLMDVDEDELLEMNPPELFNLLVWVENMNQEFLICFYMFLRLIQYPRNFYTDYYFEYV